MRLVRSLALAAVMSSALAAVPAVAQVSTAYRSAAPITPGTPVSSGDAVALACSAAGTLRLVMHDGSFLDFYAQQGTAIVDNLAVRDVNAAATTATCTVSVLRRS
jgi:hypothetical protein